VLQCVAACCSVLQCVAVCCSVLQCDHSIEVLWLLYDAVCCSVLQCVAMCCNVLQCVAVCCSVLQCDGSTKVLWLLYAAVCCKVLQRAAVCCSMIVGLRCCVCYMTHACVLCNTSISSTCHIHLGAMTNWVCVRLWPIFRVRFCGFYTSHLYVLCYTTLPYAWHDASKCAMWWNVPCDSQLWHKSSAHLSIYVPPYVIYDMTLWPWHDSSARCGFHRSHPYVLYDTSICVTWRINMCHVTHNCDMTHPLVCPYMCLHMYFVIWPYDRDMTHPLTFWYMRIYTCDMTKK